MRKSCCVCLGFQVVWQICYRLCGIIAALLAVNDTAQASQLSILHPVPWQVVQRVGDQPPQVDSAQPTSSQPTGSAFVKILARISDGPAEITDIQVRTQLLKGGNGHTSEWRTVSRRETLDAQHAFEVMTIVPAGGWYRIELRATDAVSGEVLTADVSPFGVGEVFVVAGQSYATNTNDQQFQVKDPLQRVVARNFATERWGVAHDPQPAPDGSDGGSIWPPTGDQLAGSLNVPVGFANVAVGGTSSVPWLPGGELHARLVATGKSLGRFRAVLWQQGESDVIAGTSTADYVANLQKIRRAAVRSWGFEPPWLLAKSTHHPTVYSDPPGEERIRAAVEQLSLQTGFGPGPDTDSLQNEYRGGPESRRHFSAAGQQRAAALWSEVLLDRFKNRTSRLEAASLLLPDLHLTDFVWKADTIHRESSILLSGPGATTLVARLAFPARQVISVTSADGQYLYDAAKDYALTEDALKLSFHHPGPIAPIAESDLFLPADAPDSYKHRMGHPDQNLLYRPGRWFHDRNVEVTYRPDTEKRPVTVIPMVVGSLPRTLARLKAGSPLTIGLSGDSISTGADASGITSAPPFQPGFPELVVAQLRVLFDSDVMLKNRAVGGWSVANGNEDLDKLLAEKPDLILIAYGMNDVGRRNPDWYAEQTAAMVQRIRTEAPETDILLISSMLGNMEWVHTPRDMFELYQSELHKLVGAGVALADVTEAWSQMSEHKHDLDFTGNGLNHPNDFGHRLYAQVILHALMAE